MDSLPVQVTQFTQTEAQAEPPPLCVPLLMVDKDGKSRYCYHGGKCRCATCTLLRQQQLDELDSNLDAFVQSSTHKLVPAIRQVKPKQYRLEATRTSPEMAKMLLDDHIRLRKEIPTYYLPDRYYVKDFWRLRGPQDEATQTEIAIGKFGIDGCPCVDKQVCWDI
ncbi:CG30324 [Drosophila busckii]|uniref:CG30324 n=1 Tax=Drosophila busckii TaxID=30019 RepID=A0A0M4EBB6_DROBS|nr:uncharacterized protein LOC108597265 [Drosophila busckii]ALC42521.1 CG30324 [Drosophila busckii]